MDPLTASLLVAANFSTSVFSNRSQAKINKTKIDLELAQIQLQASEQALEATKNYRDYISYNAALSAMGFGGATGFNAVSSTATANLNKDIKAINRNVRYAEIGAKLGKATNTANQFASNINAGLESFKLADNLGLFKKQKKGG